MSSLFRDNIDINLQAFADTTPRHGDPHDPETGRAASLHSPGQRKSYLARNPSIDPKSLPELRDPNRAPTWDDCSTVMGWPANIAKKREREAALLVDPAKSLARHEATKPRVATELSKYRLLIHESSHACLANLAFSRPIVRVTINPDNNGNAGHSWNYRNGDANRDDLVIVAAGRISEEELLGDVYEVGCSGDDEALRKLALKLAGGNVDAANTLLSEAEDLARALVKQYKKTIRRFALRLASKREFVLDEAETAIKQAHQDVSEPELDAEWQRKIAYAQARQSVREYQAQQPAKAAPKKGRVIREWNFSNPKDVADWCRRNGLQAGTEPMGHADGYFVRTKR